MERFPSVAILVLNYNGEDCLPRCLRALQGLSYPNYQVIIIDNGSSDESLQQAKKDFPEYTYIQKETNTGFAAGMNTGITYAMAHQYDFIWLMNYDAEVLPNTLSQLLEAHTDDASRQAMSPIIKDTQGHIWFAGGRINFFRMRTEHQTTLSATTPYQTEFLTGCAPLFSKEVFQQVGMFDERFFLYYEDADFSTRILAAGYTLSVVPSAVVIHAEKSNMNPQKLYYLVYFGLLFFALHTPKHFRPYIVTYVTIRRLVNQIKLLLGLPGARTTASAYVDYFRKFQARNQLYLHKLS